MPINSTLLTRLKGQWSLRPVTIRLLQLGRLSCYQLTLLRQMAGVEGLEPPTYRLTVYRSTNWTIHPSTRFIRLSSDRVYILPFRPWNIYDRLLILEFATSNISAFAAYNLQFHAKLAKCDASSWLAYTCGNLFFPRKQRPNKLISGASSSHHRLLRMRILFTILP